MSKSFLMQLVDQHTEAADFDRVGPEEDRAIARHYAIRETISTVQAATLDEAAAQLVIAAGNMRCHVDGYVLSATEAEQTARLIESALDVVRRQAGVDLAPFERFFTGVEPDESATVDERHRREPGE